MRNCKLMTSPKHARRDGTVNQWNGGKFNPVARYWVTYEAKKARKENESKALEEGLQDYLEHKDQVVIDGYFCEEEEWKLYRILEELMEGAIDNDNWVYDTFGYFETMDVRDEIGERHLRADYTELIEDIFLTAEEEHERMEFYKELMVS